MCSFHLYSYIFLVEIRLFFLFNDHKDFCPEYDRVGQLIQIDMSTHCNFSRSLRHYLSSNGFQCKYMLDYLYLHSVEKNKEKATKYLYEDLFCFLVFFYLGNPENCLKLSSTNVYTSRTTLISVPTYEIKG